MKRQRENGKKTGFVTKRMLVQASKNAVRKASKRAMHVAGYVVKVKDGWVVRENKDGSIKRILPLRPAVKPNEIVLD